MSDCLNSAAENASAKHKHVQRWFWKGVTTVLAIVVGSIVLHGRGARATAAEEAPGSADITPVAAVKVARHDLSLHQSFEAEFRPFQEIEIYAKVSGFLQAINVDVGDRVQAGQCLATIEVPELNDDLAHALATLKRSEQEVKRAQSDYDEAHVTLTRLTSADKAQPNLIAQQDIDLVRSKDSMAEAGLAGAKDQVAVAEADVKKLKTMLAYCKITAPFSGVITRRSVDPGALVHGTTSTSPMMRLSQNDKLRLVFPVSVSYVPLIKEGDSIEVHLPSVQTNFVAKISRFTRKIDTATRTMEVEADVPNADLSLVPGMYASVSVTTERHNQALAVPIEAVSRQKSATVYLINSKGEIEERTITTGLETAGEVEVITGLNEGDMVMIGSHAQVVVGQKVSPKVLTASINAH
jgi:RND family efflux transporter MFP subunit